MRRRSRRAGTGSTTNGVLLQWLWLWSDGGEV
jgi:hypothetical protein